MSLEHNYWEFPQKQLAMGSVSYTRHNMKQMYNKENDPWEENDYLNDEKLLRFSGLENVTLMELYMTDT